MAPVPCEEDTSPRGLLCQGDNSPEKYKASDRRIGREWRKKNIERQRGRVRAWRQKNQEKMKAWYRNDRLAKPEKYKEARRRFYLRHRERLIERRTEWRLANPEKNKQMVDKCSRLWKARNAERIRVTNRNRDAKKKMAGGSHTAADIKHIFQLQRGRCAYCRKDLQEKYHVDHIIPLARGGSNDRRNLQLLCIKCNLTKATRDPIVHAQSLGLLV